MSRIILAKITFFEKIFYMHLCKCGFEFYDFEFIAGIFVYLLFGNVGYFFIVFDFEGENIIAEKFGIFGDFLTIFRKLLLQLI